jgi:hypothetical protein
MYESHLRQLLDRQGVRNHRGPLRAKAPAGDGKGKTPTGGASGGDDEGDDEEDLDARIARVIDTKLNAAITGHTKRLKSDLEKSLGDVVAKALSEKKPADDRPADQGGNAPAGAAAKADPEVLKMREQLEKLTRSQAESEARAKAAEQKAARDATHATLREQLDSMGIKGPRARAVIHDLEASGMLKLSESGVYELTVKRARAKGAKAEELVFEDLADGLKDWALTEDAREFLPPPSSAAAKPGARPVSQAASQPRRAATTPTDRPLSDEEVAAELARAGTDLAAAFRE